MITLITLYVNGRNGVHLTNKPVFSNFFRCMGEHHILTHTYLKTQFFGLYGLKGAF